MGKAPCRASPDWESAPSQLWNKLPPQASPSLLGPSARRISFLVFSSPLLPPDLPQGLREACLLLLGALATLPVFPTWNISCTGPSFSHAPSPSTFPIPRPAVAPVAPGATRCCWHRPGAVPGLHPCSHSTTANTRWETQGEAEEGVTPKNWGHRASQPRGDRRRGKRGIAVGNEGLEGWESLAMDAGFGPAPHKTLRLAEQGPASLPRLISTAPDAGNG